MMKRAMLLSAVLALAWAIIARADDKIDFTTQIQPILVEHCAKCHGADKAAGKMRLNTAAAIQEKLAAKPELLVAGKPEESELYQAAHAAGQEPEADAQRGRSAVEGNDRIDRQLDQAGGRDPGRGGRGCAGSTGAGGEAGRVACGRTGERGGSCRRCPRCRPRRKRRSIN